MIINFFVPGIPATAGSKRPFIYKSKKDGKNKVAMCPDNKRQKPWMTDVKFAAAEAYSGDPITGPVRLSITFILPRPKSHFGTGKNADVLKPSAPKMPITKPDLTKMIRAVEDALRGVIWKDDNQVVGQKTDKIYGNRSGAVVVVYS